MAGNEIGKGYITVEPDAKGFGPKTEKAVTSELSGVGKKAGGKLGSDIGDGVSDGLGKSLPKAKTGIKGFADDMVGAFAAIPVPVLAAGAAIGAFALKGVNDFQNLALAAGKLHDSTGLATEDASRWVEVAGDVGVSTDQLGTSFGFLLKSIGKNPEAFQKLGVTAKDANGQIIQAIDLLNQTPAGAERAALGVKLFGRSWDEMSELVALGADAVTTALGEVDGAKIIDDEDVSQARAYRASMDQLGDAIDEVALTIGQSLVPALAKAFEGLAKILDSPVVKAALEVIVSGIDAVGVSLNNLSGGGRSAWADQFKGIEALTVSLELLKNTGVDSLAAYRAALLAANPDVDLGPFEEQAAAALWVRDGMNYAARAAQEYEQSAAIAGEASVNAIPDMTSFGEALSTNVAAGAEAADTALRNYLNTVLASENSQLAAEIAADRVGDSVRAASLAWDEAQVAVDDAKTPINEVVEAQDKAADAARTLRGDVLGVAASALKAAEDQASLAGGTLSAEDAARAQIDALLAMKAQYPAVAGQVDGLIAKLNATPESKKTDINVTDNGTVSQTQAFINSIHGGDAVIRVRGDFSDYDAARRARGAGGVTGPKIAFDTGGITPGAYSQAVPIIAHGQEVIVNPDQQANLLWAIANGSMAAGHDGASVAGPTIVVEKLYGTIDRAFALEMQGRLKVLAREQA